MVLGMLSLSLCLFTAGVGKGYAQEKFQLRVSLYSWIPHNQELADWIKADFERINPDIELIVRPMKKRDEADLSYDVPMALAALLIKDRDDYQDVILLRSIL
jgi:thiamine pyridinylase